MDLSQLYDDLVRRHNRTLVLEQIGWAEPLVLIGVPSLGLVALLVTEPVLAQATVAWDNGGAGVNFPMACVAALLWVAFLGLITPLGRRYGGPVEISLGRVLSVEHHVHSNKDQYFAAEIQVQQTYVLWPGGSCQAVGPRQPTFTCDRDWKEGQSVRFVHPPWRGFGPTVLRELPLDLPLPTGDGTGPAPAG